MSTETKTASTNLALLWTGRVLSALPVALLLFSAIMKFVPMSAEAAGQMEDQIGWKSNLLVPLGITELVCTILYAIPQTSVLGAILLTGYMGGAIATHVRINDYFAVQAALGVVIWLGLFLREPRLRTILPWRT